MKKVFNTIICISIILCLFGCAKNNTTADKQLDEVDKLVIEERQSYNMEEILNNYNSITIYYNNDQYVTYNGNFKIINNGDNDITITFYLDKN